MSVCGISRICRGIGDGRPHLINILFIFILFIFFFCYCYVYVSKKSKNPFLKGKKQYAAEKQLILYPVFCIGLQKKCFV